MTTQETKGGTGNNPKPADCSSLVKNDTVVVFTDVLYYTLWNGTATMVLLYYFPSTLSPVCFLS
jgi:hypothetical protein